MKPYLFPALVVGVVALTIGGWLAAIGFSLAIYYYSKYTYCMDMNRDRKLLRELRAEVQKVRFDTNMRRVYTKA